MIKNFISELIKKIEEIKFSSSFQKVKEFWNSSSQKFKKSVIVGTVLFLLLICCLCCLFSPSNSSDPPQSPTISITDVSATIYSEIDLRTEMVATIYAELDQTQQALSTPTIEKISTANPSPTLTISDKKLIVTFIDVGQGDAILIRSPEGLFTLIDGGEQGSGVVDYLHSQGVQNLDLIIATHPHSDHIGGLVDVLKNFPISRVITNGELHTTLVYENFLDAIAFSQADYFEVTRGNSIQIGSLTLEVLNPEHVIEGGLNDNSIVMRLDYAGTSFLFTGDASKDNEAEIRLRKELTPSDAVQVHIKTDSGGSPSSTSLGYVSISNAVLEESSFPMMKVSFDPVISLTASMQYWIVIQRSGAYSATDHYVVGVDEALSFTGGQFKIYNASTSAWGLRAPNCDLIFRLIGIKQTTLQLADIYTAANQFMTGLIVEPGSNVYTLPYYQAGETSLEVFEKLLRLGTSRKRLMLAEVKADRQLVITEQPVQGEEDYFIDQQGKCYDAFHNPLLPGFTPVGHWLRFSKPVQVGVKLHDPHLPSAFIVSAQLDVETEKTELGSITP